ncbi:MAG: homogentisate 1,2-dioxygenase [Gammaproteobacteria bacterium]|nr:homogentisate 1,2-dioxygenase [Gammaproteobacteria bacterium]
MKRYSLRVGLKTGGEVSEEPAAYNAESAWRYSAGFANEHSSEALPGALPSGQFSPQQQPYGLYAEKFSATAFTVARRDSRRCWFYRIRPSVVHGPSEPYLHANWQTAPLSQPAPPAPLRWSPLALPSQPTDFLDGLVTLAANGNSALHTGIGVHLYLANRSMGDRYLLNADGELLLVPQLGRLLIATECGRLAVSPGEIALIPRGLKFSVTLPDGPSRGYVCENYGAAWRLPERGVLGSDGLANDRDFLAPTAWFEDRAARCELVTKFDGGLWRSELTHSPLDVVAWVGTAAPLKYDLARFNAINTVSFDHPDPSIFTVLSSPSDTPGVANADFVIFPPRWLVAEHSFRPPWFHRNVMSEFMGLVQGQYDARRGGFEPGGASLHNGHVPHGPEAAVHAAATTQALTPRYLADTLAFMFESRYLLRPSAQALSRAELQPDYAQSWAGLAAHFSA